jgi:enoyl-CoA hydratase/carnithine racemase
VDRDGSVAIITINRPDVYNAVNDALHSGLVRIWKLLGNDPDLRAVVITGAGKAFSAGGDMAWLAVVQGDEQRRAMLMREARDLVIEMLHFPLPVIAAVNGPAVGLGCSVAVLSDVVLIAEDAYLADPHVAVGLVAGDGGALMWPYLIGPLRAKELLFTGDRVPADDAVRLGLANRAVPRDKLLAEAMALAHRLSELPSRALQDTKRAVNLHLEHAVATVLNFALAAQSETFSLPEHRDRVAQFLERRN